MISGFVFAGFILFLRFCFLPGLSESEIDVSVLLFFWPAQVVCSQGMPAGIEGLDTGMILEREDSRRSL